MAFLYVDGACRGNPGPASVGASLQNSQFEETAVVSKAIGKTTNNVAEYQALISGLELARQERISHLTVRADSQLMIRQMLGVYKVKTPHILELWKQAKALTVHFEKLQFEHIPREQNSRADELANLALDA